MRLQTCEGGESKRTSVSVGPVEWHAAGSNQKKEVVGLSGRTLEEARLKVGGNYYGEYGRSKRCSFLKQNMPRISVKQISAGVNALTGAIIFLVAWIFNLHFSTTPSLGACTLPYV